MRVNWGVKGLGLGGCSFLRVVSYKDSMKGSIWDL